MDSLPLSHQRSPQGKIYLSRIDKRIWMYHAVCFHRVDYLLDSSLVWKHYESEVRMLISQLCLTLYDPMDCSPPGSFVHGILQARILEWVAIPFSRGSSYPRHQTGVSCIAGRFFTIWATREAPWKHYSQCHMSTRAGHFWFMLYVTDWRFATQHIVEPNVWKEFWRKINTSNILLFLCHVN